MLEDQSLLFQLCLPLIYSQRSVSKDDKDNLIHPLVTVQDGILIGKFTKKMKNEDLEHDIDLSNPDGIVMFVPGGEVGSNKSYSFLPEKINLTQYLEKKEKEPPKDTKNIETDTNQPVVNEMINFSYEDPPDKSPEVPSGEKIPLTSTSLQREESTEDPHTITVDVDVNYLTDHNEDPNKHLVAAKPTVQTVEPLEQTIETNSETLPYHEGWVIQYLAFRREKNFESFFF